MTALLESFDCFNIVEGFNNVTKKHHAVEYNIHVDIINLSGIFCWSFPFPFSLNSTYLTLYSIHMSNWKRRVQPGMDLDMDNF